MSVYLAAVSHASLALDTSRRYKLEPAHGGNWKITDEWLGIKSMVEFCEQFLSRKGISPEDTNSCQIRLRWEQQRFALLEKGPVAIQREQQKRQKLLDEEARKARILKGELEKKAPQTVASRVIHPHPWNPSTHYSRSKDLYWSDF